MKMKMGGGELHQELKNLCVNTDWNYAVFWNLKHQAKMVLTWEDAYYDKNDHSRNNWFDNMDESYAQDLLGLAVAKMSYRVYSLGEGIVGRVAVTGKHLWISEDELVNNSCYSDEHFDGWKTQFLAGIRTIVVIAIIPHGVVQLGSLNTIAEDLKLVNHVGEIFFELQNSLSGSIDCSPCVSELSTRSSSSAKFHDKTMKKNTSNNSTTIGTIINHQKPKYPTSDIIKSATCNNQNINLFMPEIPNGKTNLEFQTETNESFKFLTGCELFEALGPMFCKQNDSFGWESGLIEPVTFDETPNGSSLSDILTQRSGSEHLLEAVVANGSVKSCARLQPPSSDGLTGGSVRYSFEGSVHNTKTSLEPVKVRKKRPRPGESCRPRPRDRQLIQDRIKELRGLVPNGSKCSIDSLLERTIKHMVFMQCFTKHAKKIDKCAEFKLLGKGTSIQGPSNHEHGSSWAMEVGNHPKVCPIIVENIGVNGQMLVEMMCDQCVEFLEMVEAIRSLGLTILKGVTNVYGDKTWMCFVVEGENNRSMHRVDILWSLVQILQLKTMS